MKCPSALLKLSILALLCAPMGALATPLNANIIVNGNAEGSAGAPDFSTTSAPTGWTVTSNFSAVQYSAGAPTDLNLTDSASFGGDKNYFAGGPSNASATAKQVIDISDLALIIDAGGLNFSLSALIGGFDTQRDNMVVSAVFLDAAASTLTTSSIGPVSNVDRANVSDLLPRSANGSVPIGTRSVEIGMVATRVDGSYNDGYADNLSLVLRGNSNPIPSAAPLSLLGAGLIAWRLGRRRARR